MLAVSVVSLLFLQASAAQSYQNPVLDMDFPDPTVVKGLDGAFYAYGTMGNGHRIQVASSLDLVRTNLCFALTTD